MATNTHIELTDIHNSSNKILVHIDHIKKITATIGGCLVVIHDPYKGDYTETVSEAYATLKTALGF